jgi:hypothetical protein
MRLAQISLVGRWPSFLFEALCSHKRIVSGLREKCSAIALRVNPKRRIRTLMVFNIRKTFVAKAPGSRTRLSSFFRTTPLIDMAT